VPDDSFLRSLPKVLDTNQRMSLDMVIYSIDLVEIAMARLRHAGHHMVSKLPEFDKDPRGRRAMYLDAWSLVNDPEEVSRHSRSAGNLQIHRRNRDRDDAP
jgi:hypothetical protein